MIKEGYSQEDAFACYDSQCSMIGIDADIIIIINRLNGVF